MAGGSSDAQQSFPYSGPPAEELAKIFSSSTKFPINVDANSRLESVTGKGGRSGIGILQSRYLPRAKQETNFVWH